MDVSRLKNLLGQLRFTASLPPRAIEQLAELAELRGFPAGAVLFAEGSRNPDLYVIAVGSVGLDMNVPARGPTRLLSVGPGELLAWSALLGGGRMTAMATALEDTQVVSVDGRRLAALCDADHELGYRVMRRLAMGLSERLVATRLQLLDLFGQETPAPGADFGPRGFAS
ncbi:MAG: cyclic nucleotide-binding domain-containing protein [Pirellulales bacterium]